MPWSKPIPFSKGALNATTDYSISVSLGGIQKVRLHNLSAHVLGHIAEIHIEYASIQDGVRVYHLLAYGVGEAITFNSGAKNWEIWTDEIRADFDTDDIESKSFRFRGSYSVKQ